MFIGLTTNFYEITVAVLAALILFVYLNRVLRSWKFAAGIVALALVPLLISIERTTQFLTVDETYIIRETIDMANPRVMDLDQWMRIEVMRTTESTLGGTLTVVRQIIAAAGQPPLTDTQAVMLLKSLHWMMGFIALMWIHFLLNEHFIPEDSQTYYSGIFFVTALLLPTNNLALKVYNYDLLSMLLAVVALLYLAIALKRQNRRDAILSVILGLLAAQEKRISSPILLLSITTTACLFAVTARRYKYAWAILGALIAVGAATAAGLIFALLPALVRNWNLPDGYWLHIADPFVNWTWPIYNLLFPTAPTEFASKWFPLAILITACTVCLISVSVLLALDFLSRRGFRLEAVAPRLPMVSTILAGSVLLIGIVSTFTVNGYVAPKMPIPDGYFHPSTSFNDLTWHYGAVTAWQHELLSMAWACAVFIDSIPSVMWLALGGALLVSRPPAWSRLGILPDVFLVLGVISPIIYGALQIPVGNKYFNLWIFLVMIAITLKAVGAVSQRNLSARYALGAAYGLLIFLEVIPFAPLYAAFRPVWANYKDADKPMAGVLNPSWFGWGEEPMLAGQVIRARCQEQAGSLDGVPCDQITLYYAYPGAWVDENKGIADVRPFWFVKVPKPAPRLQYTAATYYIINRAVVIQNWVDLPSQVKPVFIISFRGYEQAWVYRGDQLAAAGCKFKMRSMQTRCVGN